MKLIKLTAHYTYAVAVLLIINISACNKLSSYDYPASVGTAYEIVKNDRNFSYFLEAVNRAGLEDLLKGSKAHTIYVPNNNAFTAAGYTNAVLQNMVAAELAVLVKNHIVEGATDLQVTAGKHEQTALSGLKITVEKKGDLFYVNGGDILNVSQATTNGYIHVTSTLLATRPTILDAIKNYVSTGNSQLTFLAAAITRASTGSTDFTALLSGSTPYTLLAPNNGAFIDGGFANLAAINAADPEVLGDILKYHLIAGAKLTTAFDSVPVTAYNGTPVYFDITPRTVTSTTDMTTNFTYWYANGICFGNAVPSNITADNGVVHTVSRLLPAPVTVSTLEYIEADPNLSLFRALVARASEGDADLDFEDLLSSPDKSYTVFAINNDGLINEGYEDETAIENEDPVVLARLLRMHMLPKRVNNINITDGETVRSLLPSGTTAGRYPVTFQKNGGFAVKGPSNPSPIPVLEANVVTTNGLVNVIGEVLKP